MDEARPEDGGEEAATRGRPRKPDGPLYRALRARGLHPAVLAVQCGVPVSYVRQWDQGSRRPPDRFAATIAALAGVREARATYELSGPPPGKGKLPRESTRRARYSWTARDLRRRGLSALAAELEATVRSEAA